MCSVMRRACLQRVQRLRWAGPEWTGEVHLDDHIEGKWPSNGCVFPRFMDCCPRNAIKLRDSIYHYHTTTPSHYQPLLPHYRPLQQYQTYQTTTLSTTFNHYHTTATFSHYHTTSTLQYHYHSTATTLPLHSTTTTTTATRTTKQSSHSSENL